MTGDGEALGIYIHVPFCSSLCAYCDFARIKSTRGVPEEFDSLLLAEARLYGTGTPLPVDTVYFGGGTPSLLDGKRLKRLLHGLRGIFPLAPDAEVTLEANPETVTGRSLGGWREAGITRLSIGGQSFDQAVLDRLGRGATADQVHRAVVAAAEGGFSRCSLDLMTGVPGQDEASLRRDLAHAVSLPLDHLSVYGLDLHPKTPLYRQVAERRAELPGEAETARFLEVVDEELTAHGFDHYEISNFARPGGRCLHNLKYWRCEPTLGLGPSAWSRFDGRIAGNPRSYSRWRRAVEEGRQPWETVEALTPSRMAEDRLIFGLRLSEGVSWAAVRDLLGSGGRDPEALVGKLAEQGYASFDGGSLALTPSGFRVSNEILAYLLPAGWVARPGAATITSPLETPRPGDCGVPRNSSSDQKAVVKYLRGNCPGYLSSGDPAGRVAGNGDGKGETDPTVSRPRATKMRKDKH